MADDKGLTKSDKNEPNVNAKKKHRGIMSRIWHGIFRLHGDNLEKRLQNISKEEAAVLTRIKRRSLTWRKMARHLIIFSVIFEVIAVGYAIMTTRSIDLDWKMRVFRVLPMFLLPGLSSAAYSAFASFTRICDSKDQKTLEKLQAERQAKIDELKEKTNYYTTQQLIQESNANKALRGRVSAKIMGLVQRTCNTISEDYRFNCFKPHSVQRYDPDPAAKAAAATVLASKLGSDSGLKVYVEDEAKLNSPTAKSCDVEFVQVNGLRNRKHVHCRSISAGSSPTYHSNEEMPYSAERESIQPSENNQLVVEHQNPQAYTVHDGGWIARLAALLVGDDPTQSYALICGNCHMHNGLARKEDFPYITYYCPHCHALNQPKQLEDLVSASASPKLGTLKAGGNIEAVNNASRPSVDNIPLGNNPINADTEVDGKVTERLVQGELAS